MTGSHHPKQIVRDGYDTVSYAYRTDMAPDQPYRTWLQPLIDDLEPGAAVLDLGCGCGIPASRILAERFSVIGVDISPVQIERAHKLVPHVAFQCADMTTLQFADASFAAIVSLYALIHIPLDEQPAMFDRITRWLRPGGWFVATLGESAWTGTEHDWLGIEGGTMYWSQADAATYIAWLHDRRFRLIEQCLIPENDHAHLLVVARLEAET